MMKKEQKIIHLLNWDILVFIKDLNKFLINRNISFSKIIKEFINEEKLFFFQNKCKILQYN